MKKIETEFLISNGTLLGYYGSNNHPIVPKYASSIGSHAFEAKRDTIKSVTLPDTLRSIGSYAFCGCKSIEEIILPDGVFEILEGAFLNCTGLKRIVLPESLRHIDTNAFHGCSSLCEITIPKRVKSIGFYAFARCTGLSSITIHNDTSVQHGAFFGSKTDKLLIVGNGNPIDSKGFWGINVADLILVGDIPVICEDTFGRNKFLQRLYIGESSINAMKNGDFAEALSLCEISPSKELVKIGEGAFCGCSSLKEVTLSSGLKTIGSNAFSGCCELERIVIPEGTEEIGSKAFYNCAKLREVYIPQSVNVLRESAFEDGYTTPWSLYVCDSLEIISACHLAPENFYQERLKLCVAAGFFKAICDGERVSEDFIEKHIEFFASISNTKFKRAYSSCAAQLRSVITKSNDIISAETAKLLFDCDAFRNDAEVRAILLACIIKKGDKTSVIEKLEL